MKIGDIKDLVPAERLAAWGVDPDEIQRANQAKAALFDAWAVPFLVTKAVCQNPDCYCRTVNLHFMELGVWPPSRKGFHFSIEIDTDTMVPRAPAGSQQKVRAFIEEFSSGFGDDLKAELRNDFESVRAKLRAAADFVMAHDAIPAGELVSYNDVFSRSKSIMSGGRSYAFRFDHENSTFIAEDMYCINPGCSCREAHLVFLRLVTPGLWSAIRGKATAESLFKARVGWRRKVDIEIDKPGFTEYEAIGVFEALSAAEPTLIKKLKNRYEAMKDIGARILEKKHAPSKPDRAESPSINAGYPGSDPGRNEPCPCGSGKKYKRCCGK